ncbi:MAG: adenosylcobalamin-dependent ribonucleoside-diphosphate reductase, partial [Pseudomonadota bacterium]
MSAFAAPIAEQIWDMKYRFKSPEGAPLDADLQATWDRVAAALAAVEDDPAAWTPRFRAALQDFRYLPAGRILAGAGTGRTVTLFNCFVMGTIEDSMAGIFDGLKEAALTMQQGGGIGYDFSPIRPKGAPVAGVGADASGPLSFMDVWDAMCRTIMSAGSRRGAMMATLRCDHPDIEAFIDAKRDPARLRMFNLSVLVTDPFMAAVKADAAWDLTFDGRIHRTVQARALWDRIMRATYDYAEPGVIFIDRINQANNLSYVEEISATNPCGEQPLPPYGACLLGSVNLARLVKNPFAEDAHIDDAELADLVATSVRMMDNVVDASRFPLEAQAQEARAKRRIGLGVTGLADALLMTGLRYGSEDAAAQTEAWLRAVARAAYLASAALAREKGPFPLFDAEAFLASPTVQAMDEDVRAAIAEHGIRNALLTSIAPTGTISLLAGNVSSGIEPVFAFSYSRKVLQPDGTR